MPGATSHHVRRPEAGPDHHPRRAPSPAPTGSGPAVGSQLVALQRAAGNRTALAAQAVGLTRPATVQRLADLETFQLKVGEARKGWIKDSSTIDRLEELWEKLEHDKGMAPDQRITVLDEVRDTIKAWTTVHGNERGRVNAARWLNQQRLQAAREITRLQQAPNGNNLKSTYDRSKNKIVRKAEAPDMNGALAMLAGMLDMVCSAPGSKGEVELEVDIPVHPPAFVGFRFKVEGDRSEAEKLKARLELAFTGGAHISGSVGRAAGELGGFSESQGRDSREVMTLFSYGLYRRARESSLSVHKLTNALWGGGKSDTRGWDSAETWATDVETKVLGQNSDAYVSSGGFGRGAVEVGLHDVGKVAGDLQVGGGKVWDAAGIKAIADAKSEWSDAKIAAVAAALAAAKPTTISARQQVVDELAVKKHIVNSDKLKAIVARSLKVHKKGNPWDVAALTSIIEDDFAYEGKQRTGLGTKETERSGALESKAERLAYFKSSGQVNAGPGMAACKVEGSWTTRGRDGTIPTHLREAKIEVKGGFAMPMGKLLGGAVLEAFDFQTLASGLVSIIRMASPKDAKMNATQKVGQSALPMQGLTEMGLQVGQVPTQQFSSALAQSNPLTEGISGSATVQLVIEGKMKGQKPEDLERSKELKISIGQEQAMRVEAVVARVKAKTFSRWFSLSWKPTVAKKDGSTGAGSWAIDIAGQTGDGTYGAKDKTGKSL